MMRFILFILFLWLSEIMYSQDISFFKEDIQFTLDTGSFEVNGLYFFRNLSDREIRKVLFYPFPEVVKYGKVSSIQVCKQDDTTSRIATISEKGSLYTLILDSNEETIYQIKYTQKLISHQAKYIFTTTQDWGNPLETAYYSLNLPDHILIDSLSFVPDSIIRSDNATKYIWNMQKFMPENDFNVWFSEKH